MKYRAVTALVTFILTAIFMTIMGNRNRNEFFHVVCESPNGGAVYGPYWMEKKPDLGLLADKFCNDATPYLYWPPRHGGFRSK